MHPLAVLKYCRQVLKERQRKDAWQGWFWKLRIKVADYWIACLERVEQAPPAAELTAPERAAVLATHPLLAARHADASRAAEPDRQRNDELRARVARYIKATQSRR